ncbi:hypothetical protein Scep_006630 [Stephania cephalantha]|uniref:Gag protein n=1 Tax=Stephania cephalantha TaxID=152367 RepID=A0AAP0KA15_9MAGN
MPSRGSFIQHYFPPAMIKRLRKEFMNLRQKSDESVMSYRDIYGYLRQFTGDLVKEDLDDVYHFGDGLKLDIEFYVVNSCAKNSGEIYERALSHETYYLGRVTNEIPLVPPLTPDQVAEYEMRRQRGKGPRRWDRGSQGSGTSTTVVPFVSSLTPLQTIVGRPPLPPPVKPALSAPTTTLPALPAQRQQQQGGTSRGRGRGQDSSR